MNNPFVNQPLSDWTNINSKPEITVGDAGYTTLATTITALGSTPCSVIVKDTQVGGGLTTPATMALRVLKTANITIATGTTLTINGPFEAGLYQVFSCTGTGAAVFGNKQTAYAVWFGALPDGSTACATPIAKAVASGCADLRFHQGASFYSVGAHVSINRTMKITLEGAATIRNTTGDTVALGADDLFQIGYSNSVQGVVIEGGILEGVYSGGAATWAAVSDTGHLIHTPSTNDVGVTVRNVTLRNSWGSAFWGGRAANAYPCLIDDCVISGNGAFGVSPNGNMTIRNSELTGNKYFAVDTSVNNARVESCYVHDNGGGNHVPEVDTHWGGLLNNGAANTAFINNYVYDNLGLGIFLGFDATLLGVDRNIIKGNHVWGHTDATGLNPVLAATGILVDGANDTLITDNICYDNYDNYRVTCSENSTAFYNVNNLMLNGNISKGATNIGYRWENKVSGSSGTAVAGDFVGCDFINNKSVGDATAYSLPTAYQINNYNNQTVVAETLGPELLTNAGFETNNPPDNWITGAGVTVSQVTDNRPDSAGTKAIEVTYTGAVEPFALSDVVKLMKEKLYKLSGWIKVSSGANGQILIYDADGAGAQSYSIPVTGGWQQVTCYYRAANSGPNGHRFGLKVAAGSVVRFDDVSLKEVTSVQVIKNYNRIFSTDISSTDATITAAEHVQYNTDRFTNFKFLAIAQDTNFATPAGTPVDAQRVVFWIYDAGVQKNLTWGAIFVSTAVVPAANTTVGKWTRVEFEYNSTLVKWVCIKSDVTA